MDSPSVWDRSKNTDHLPHDDTESSWMHCNISSKEYQRAAVQLELDDQGLKVVLELTVMLG